MPIVLAPTEAQKEAGNYKKDHGRIHGLDIAIENRKGSKRSGTDKGGKPWSVTMPAHYGYIKGTEGADGDHVDCYLGPHLDSDRVFVINQLNADTGAFDEHKCMLGFRSADEAKFTYRRGFSGGKGDQRLGSMKEMSIDQFKAWLKDGSQKKPARASGGRIERACGGGVDPAMALASRVKRVTGGNVPGMNVHTGPIVSDVGGRTDKHEIAVPSGSYVVPADLISGLGQGNTNNGMVTLSKAFPKSGPYGSAMPKMKPARRRRAEGGGIGIGEPTPILAAGGEFVISPEDVAALGDGDVDAGHSVLDAWVVQERKKIIDEMRKLPGPARD